MTKIRHPHVLLTMGIAVDGWTGATGIVMLCMQASLQDVLHEKEFMSTGVYGPHVTWDSGLLSIVGDVVLGMECIHASGLLHRDLKPGNVLLDAQARPPHLLILPWPPPCYSPLPSLPIQP